MSGAKFASLTGGLLARKGEARPSEASPPYAFSFSSGFAPVQTPERIPAPPLDESWQPAVVARTPRPERAEILEQAAVVEPAKHAPPEAAAKPSVSSAKARRLMVSLSSSEHETLGIIAVKKGVTRHQLLRNALDEYLALLVEEYAEACSCIYSGCSCAAPA